MADEKDTKAEARPAAAAADVSAQNPHDPDPGIITQAPAGIATADGLKNPDGTPYKGEATHPHRPPDA